jgi:hypothetical protein
MSDKDIEQQIQAKGLTAPRVTPDHIERYQRVPLSQRRRSGSGGLA